MKETESNIVVTATVVGVPALIVMILLIKYCYDRVYNTILTSEPDEATPLIPPRTEDAEPINHTQNIATVVNITQNSVAFITPDAQSPSITKQTIQALRDDLTAVTERLTKVEDESKIQIAKLERKVQEHEDKTAQNIAAVLQYSLNIDLESAALVANLKSKDDKVSGYQDAEQVEATLRTLYYKEALNNAAGVARDTDLTPLAEYLEEQSGTLGNTNATYDEI